MNLLDYSGNFEYKHQLFNRYSIGKIIVDIRSNLVEVEVMYYKDGHNSYTIEKHPFKVVGEVDIELLLDKIYKKHLI
jgi:hypothetical protein